MDRIAVRGMRVFARHGANPGEQDVPQPFDIDCELEIDLSAAAASDALADTYNYAALHAHIGAVMGASRYALLERLGDEIIREIWRDERVRAVALTIAKPGLLGGATPSVTLRRSR